MSCFKEFAGRLHPALQDKSCFFHPSLGLVRNTRNHNTDYKVYGTAWYRINANNSISSRAKLTLY
jgi:hypothetical protein